MKTILTAFALAVLLPALCLAATADQAPYGPVHGRAYSVDTRHFLVNGNPGPTVVIVDQKVQLPSLAFTDIESTCPEKLVELFCTVDTFLEKCSTTETPYGFFITPTLYAFGSVLTCDPVNAGPCVEVSGHLVSKDLPELEDVVSASSCAF